MYTVQIKRKLIFAVLIAGLQLSVFAAPQVTFERFWDDEPGGGITANPNPRGGGAAFSRELNASQIELFNEMQTAGYKPKTASHKGIHLLTGQFKMPYRGFKVTYRYFYTLNANDLVNGYLLLEPVSVFNDESFPVSPIRQMKQLPENPAFLTGLDLPSQLNIKVYEQKTAGFVERYIFIQYLEAELKQLQHILLVDAYYPEALDQKFSKDTQRYLERFVKDAAVLYGLASH